MASHFIYSQKNFFRRIAISLKVFFKKPFTFIVLPFLGITLTKLAIALIAIGAQRISFLTERGDSLIYIAYPDWKIQIVLVISTFIVSIIFASLTVIAPIQTMMQLDRANSIYFFKNIRFGFSKIPAYIGYLWNLFKYVYLVPTITLIILLAIQAYLITSSVEHFGRETLYYAAQYGGLIVIVLTLIYTLSRGIQAVFGVYFLVEEETNGKESLKSSIKTTKNHWWKMFSNVFGIIVLASIALEIVSYGLYQLFTQWHSPLDGWQIDIINRTSLYSDKLSVLGFSGGFTVIAVEGIMASFVMIFIMLLLRTIQLNDHTRA